MSVSLAARVAFPTTGAKSKDLPQQHLRFASSGVGPYPRTEQSWLCLFQDKGCAAVLLGDIPWQRWPAEGSLAMVPGGRSCSGPGTGGGARNGPGSALGSAPGAPHCQGSFVPAQKRQLPSLHQRLDPLVRSCVSVRESSSGVYRASPKEGNACAALPCCCWVRAQGGCLQGERRPKKLLPCSALSCHVL